MERTTTSAEDTSVQKRQLRLTCRQLRTDLGEAKQMEASMSICRWIEAWSIFQQSHTILSYLPMSGEINLISLLETHTLKLWILPRIVPEENHKMVFHPYVPGKLIKHAFGMAEPTPDLPVIPPRKVQLALVPGLAYDRSGRRLGYGGGYFDRFLRVFNGVSLGVTYQALLFDQLPHDEHDVPVKWIVTEAGIISADPGEGK